MNSAHGYVTYSRLNGTVILEAPKITLPELAILLRREIGMPVLDRTGLQGFYQVSLYVPGTTVRARRAMPQPEDSFQSETPIVPSIPMASDPEGVNLFRSIQRIGLKLEKSKSPIERLVVERAEQNPVEQ